MKILQSFRIRLARKRLIRALDACTEADLKRAAALHRWFTENHLMPGDKITITFDGENTDVVVIDLQTRYLKEREQIFKSLQDET